jgi:hypothetical protein
MLCAQIAYCYHLLGEYEVALYYYKKELQLMWDLNMESQEIGILDHMGLEYYYLGDIEKSIYYHNLAMRGTFVLDRNLKHVSSKSALSQHDSFVTTYMFALGRTQQVRKEFIEEAYKRDVREKCMARMAHIKEKDFNENLTQQGIPKARRKLSLNVFPSPRLLEARNPYASLLGSFHTPANESFQEAAELPTMPQLDPATFPEGYTTMAGNNSRSKLTNRRTAKLQSLHMFSHLPQMQRIQGPTTESKKKWTKLDRILKPYKDKITTMSRMLSGDWVDRSSTRKFGEWQKREYQVKPHAAFKLNLSNYSHLSNLRSPVGGFSLLATKKKLSDLLQGFKLILVSSVERQIVLRGLLPCLVQATSS